jgi:hypothetical protein
MKTVLKEDSRILFQNISSGYLDVDEYIFIIKFLIIREYTHYF